MKQKTKYRARTPEEDRRIVLANVFYEDPRLRLLKASPAQIARLGQWGSRALDIARAWHREGRVPSGEEKMILDAVGHRLPL